MKKKIALEIISFLLVLLFTYAAVSKLLDQRVFIFQMGLSPFYPVKHFAYILGWMVPCAELLTAALLMFERTRNYGLLASLCLLLAFEIYIGMLLISGWNLPCTCGGVISRLSWKGHLSFNAIFIVLAAYGYLIKNRRDLKKDIRAAILQL